MTQAITDKIKVVQVKISVEKDPQRKSDLQKQLRKLQLRNEIEKLQGGGGGS
jgi:hypothetical protein